MSSEKFLLKAFNTVSALALTVVIFGFTPHTSAWAMNDDDPQQSAPGEKDETRRALPKLPSRSGDDVTLSEKSIVLKNNPQIPQEYRIIQGRKPTFAGTFNPEGKFVPEPSGRTFFVDRPQHYFKYDHDGSESD